VLDTEEPTRWLEGGELVISAGEHFPTEPIAQARYLERLMERGIAGIAFPEEFIEKISSKARAAADSGSLPVFSVSSDVSYQEIVRAVAAGNTVGAQRRLMTQVRVFGSLQSRSSQDVATAELLATVADIAGYDLFGATNDGGALLPGLDLPPDGIGARLPRVFDRTVTVDGAYVLPVAVGGRIMGYVVAKERAAGAGGGLVSVQYVATIVGLEVERVLLASRAKAAHRATLLSGMLAGELGARVVSRVLTAEGFDSGTVVVTALSGANGDRPSHAECLSAQDLLALTASPYMLTEEDHVYVLTSDEAPVRSLLDGYPTLRGGLSAPFSSAGDFALARRQALIAVHTALRLDERLVLYGPNLRHLVSLPADRATLAALAESVLGPLHEYDRKHHNALVDSLRCYLQHDRQLAHAAEALMVHRNSLLHRLRRIEQLTGRRLTDISCQTEFWLALEAERLLSPSDDV
jgi:purine catabolism regulator